MKKWLLSTQSQLLLREKNFLSALFPSYSLVKRGMVLIRGRREARQKSWQEHSLSHLLMKISWTSWASLPLTLAERHLTELKVQLQKQTLLANQKPMQLPRQGIPFIYCPSALAHPQANMAMKTGRGLGKEAVPFLLRTRTSSLLVNHRGSGGRPSFGTRSSQGASISVSESGCLFFLLVLRIYNKLRKKQTSLFFSLASHSLPNNVWVSLKATKC